MGKKIICIDSDGCAMDTMTIKHVHMFGPLAVEVFQIKDEAAFLQRWNEVNLYSMTRGINRFQSLAKLLNEFSASIGIEDFSLDELTEWVDTTPEFSEAALEKAADRTGDLMLHKALEWSQLVNQGIAQDLGVAQLQPFSGVLAALQIIKSKGLEIAIVSSANEQAIKTEWTHYGLMQYVDYVYGQSFGHKSDCVKDLLEQKGYSKENILLLGDAVGDRDAALQNDIFFYPILVRKEGESWKEFTDTYLDIFISGAFDQVQASILDRFSKQFD